jgi:methionine-rich copper-binding protein CopC
MTRSHCLVMLSALLLAPSPLWAHAYLVKSTPAQGAVLHHSPTKIQLWFSERLEPQYSSFNVTDASGKPVPTEKVEVSTGNPKHLSAPIKPLPPGRYLIKYRVLSVDGHIVQSQLLFTIVQ